MNDGLRTRHNKDHNIVTRWESVNLMEQNLSRKHCCSRNDALIFSQALSSGEDSRFYPFRRDSQCKAIEFNRGEIRVNDP